jgi:hypothetical protein
VWHAWLWHEQGRGEADGSTRAPSTKGPPSQQGGDSGSSHSRLADEESGGQCGATVSPVVEEVVDGSCTRGRACVSFGTALANGKKTMPHMMELLTGEAPAQQRRLDVPAVETVPVAKSCPNRRRRVKAGRSSKNLTRGLTKQLTCVGFPAAVRNGVGEACELFGVEKRKGKWASAERVTSKRGGWPITP